MIRATGGSACCATTTRSMSWSRAISSASSFDLIPNGAASSPINRTRATRMFSFSALLRGRRCGSGCNLRRGLRHTLRKRATTPAVVGADRNHADLDRRKPERKLAAVVLDQHPDEALERPEQRAVDHVRRVLAVVGTHVREPEPGRHLGVELD